MGKPRHKLLRFLKSNKRELSPLLIVTHDHPDPDAMAAAYALYYLVKERYGIRARIVHRGQIGRMENQTMVRMLRLPIHPVQEEDWKKFRAVALVDTQPFFENNPFPEDRIPALVMDHHPQDRRTKARFLLIRSRVGATATIAASVLLSLRMKIPKPLATALLYGILSETQNLGRQTGPQDMRVYRELHAMADMRVLAQIQNPVRREEFFKTLRRAVTHAFVVRRLIGVHLGRVDTPDLVSQIADFLLAFEGMRWSLCTGRYHGKLHVSLRTNNVNGGAGTVLRRVLREPGRAGGHGMVAGGHLEIGRRSGKGKWDRVEKSLVPRLLNQLHWKRGTKMVFPFKRRR